MRRSYNDIAVTLSGVVDSLSLNNNKLIPDFNLYISNEPIIDIEITYIPHGCYSLHSDELNTDTTIQYVELSFRDCNVSCSRLDLN